MRSIADKLKKIYPFDDAVIYLQSHCKSSEPLNRESLIECAYLGYLTLSLDYPRPFSVKEKMSDSPISDRGIVWNDGSLKGHPAEHIIDMDAGVYDLENFEMGERNHLSRAKGWVIKGSKGQHLRLMTYFMDGPHGDLFCGVTSLADDVRIVIKEANIESFISLLQYDTESDPTKELENPKAPQVSAKAESNNLKLIAALIETLIDKSSIESEAGLIDLLESEFKDKGGFSKRALETKFADAKRQLKGA